MTRTALGKIAMTGQWGALVLDRLVAPKCSELTACLAPELPEPYNHFVSFFLNNVLILSYPDKARSLAIVFLRRLTNATRAYRDGRHQMLRCVAALKHSNEMVLAYLNSLSHFESAIVNACLALRAHDAVGELSKAAPTPSDAPKLYAAYDALRHFDERVKRRPITGEFAAPVWLVEDGIEFEGEKRAKRGKRAKLEKLPFEELTGILRDLERDARLLAEGVFRMAQEESAKITPT